ncbi:MAG: polymer-forming cytoskeletal protein [Candidatus Nitrohelix vancouverensis]|uniref:Polymer-forming cytoskeletal protein n=1 Tax=Candidatus Nitrohelix vancouverensis TaxID=2705534 RepID=A0A7T0G2P7_9BACT|nr:MAG: polymer-forming cytoskeletal protein [Candidatus Nitrohelix vancouverensis]
MNSKPGDKNLKAYMSDDTVFKGVLSFTGAVRMDGKFEGRVETADTLIVGETGDLKAEIQVGTLVCKGKIEGSIFAKDRVELHSTSRIVGNIITPSLSMEQGSILDGNCNMSGKDGKIITLVKGESGEATVNQK